MVRPRSRSVDPADPDLMSQGPRLISERARVVVADINCAGAWETVRDIKAAGTGERLFRRTDVRGLLRDEGRHHWPDLGQGRQPREGWSARELRRFGQHRREPGAGCFEE